MPGSRLNENKTISLGYKKALHMPKYWGKVYICVIIKLFPHFYVLKTDMTVVSFQVFIKWSRYCDTALYEINMKPK